MSNLRRIGRQFRLGRQEDAHEFLCMLLDGIQVALLKRANVKPSQGRIAETTMIDRIFGGYLRWVVVVVVVAAAVVVVVADIQSCRNQMKCNLCNFRSNTYDHCLNISLDVAGNVRSINQGVCDCQALVMRMSLNTILVSIATVLSSRNSWPRQWVGMWRLQKARLCVETNDDLQVTSIRMYSCVLTHLMNGIFAERQWC